MGYYSEYLTQNLSFDALSTKRKEQLQRISELRGGRDILVYAADQAESRAPISIEFSDRLPFQDQVSTLSGKALDFILETPGGSGEVAEDFVRMLRRKYDDIAIIIPGSAMSAGTIIAMAANDILMEPDMSSLGPIDAQLQWQGKVFSAHALLAGVNKIKDEAVQTGGLNRAYIPILQTLSPGELEHAENALKFAKNLVGSWLAEYKFKDWSHHSSDNRPVTREDKEGRASQVAEELCDHSKWKSHGRSIKLADLEAMRLRITDYSTNAALAEAIQRYYSLLRMSFETPLFKVIETQTSQIYRFIQIESAPTASPFPAPPGGGQPQPPAAPDAVLIAKPCIGCGHKLEIRAKFRQGMPLPPGQIDYPANNLLKCPHCGADNDLTADRAHIERQFGRPIV